MTLSASFPAGQRNSRSSLPTTSVVSLLGVPRCRFAIFSAAGCIVSRRCRHILTNETATGAEYPCEGLISTLPSIRGYVLRADVSIPVRKARSVPHPHADETKQSRTQGPVRLTSVAEMPGYPTKKLLFGGPETRTEAAILLRGPGRWSSPGRGGIVSLAAAGHRWREVPASPCRG